MNWPQEYLSMIKSGAEVVSDKVKAVYERECSWMLHPPANFPYYFNEAEGEKHIQFIERFCKHSKGKFAGNPVYLEPFQKAKIQLVFGWKEIETDYRRIQEVVDIRGRKCGKSTETAAVEWDVLLNDNEGGPEVYCTANKKDQASLIYTECVNMRTQSPELRAISKKRQSDIYTPFNMGFIKCLAADTSTMDGLNPSFFSQDEFHAAKTSALYDVMIQGQSMRDNPLAWLISTNGFVREGFFDDKYNYCSNVALWVPGYEDYKTLPLIYELNNRDTWQDPAHWGEANPGLGKIKKLSTLQGFVDKAKRDPSFLPTVMTKDFNLPENGFGTWLEYEESISCKHDLSEEFLTKSYAIGGCDLSATTDLTCATLLVKRPNDTRIFVLQKYFLPKSRIDAVAANSKSEAPYRKWVNEGWLHECEGATVDFKAVTEWFVRMVKQFNIRPLWIGYDAALSGYWVEEMETWGFNMEKIRQGPFTWTYPMKELKGMFQEHRIAYNNPMLQWCLLNTGKKSLNKDGIESQQPVKLASNKRIDGMVSLLNAYTCYKNHEEEYLKYVR